METAINLVTSATGIAFAQWIAALGTAFATLMLAITLYLGGREKRREQASSISAWTTTRETEAGMEGTLHVMNSGDSPIFDAAARAFSDNGKTVASWPVRIIEPEKEEIPVSADFIANPHMGKDTSRLEIFFRDSHGRAWTRRRNGSLKRNFFTQKSGVEKFSDWSNEAFRDIPNIEGEEVGYIDIDPSIGEVVQAREGWEK